MQRVLVLLCALSLAGGGLFAPPPQPVSASHLANKTVVLLGGSGLALGETPWATLREQLAQRSFPEWNVLEFQYAGGTFAPDGTWSPYPGGACESFSRQSFSTLRQMMADLARVRPDHEIFLVGFSVGGFLATQALWAAAAGDAPEAWDNLSGIVSISGPMSGLSRARSTVQVALSAEQGCADPSMLAWMEEVGAEPDRYAANEARAAQVMPLGFKIGSFGNTVDCAYRYISDDICPRLRERVRDRAALLRALPDERPTQFIKNGSIFREYNIVLTPPGEVLDNHSAVLVSTGPMAELAEFVLSQTR